MKLKAENEIAQITVNCLRATFALHDLGRATRDAADAFEGYALTHNLMDTWVWSMETWGEDD